MFISGIAIFILINPFMKELYGQSDWSSSMVLFQSSYENIEGNLLPNNIFTRIVMWHQVLIELFPTNLIGVGIGTMLWPHPHVIQPIGTESSHLYYIGAHNSFITIFGRFGIVYGILHYLIYKRVFEYYYINKKIIFQNNDRVFYLIFLVVTIISFFNVALESPIHASMYWVSLGIVSSTFNVPKLRYE